MQRRHLICLLALWSASLVPAVAADAPLIDNERVKIWDTKSRMASMPDDFVAIPFDKGTATYGHAGEAAGTDGTRTVIIDLKNHPVPALVNNSGYPNAYPRPHITKLFENDRVIVWNYHWTPGEPTPMHFHNTDVVVTYLEDSALQSTEPSGKAVLNEYKSGDIRFNKGNRVHTELLVRGSGSAVITEVK